MYYRKDVQGPDAYLREQATGESCKIKAARRLNRKPLTWLAFNRAGRSIGVPPLRFLPAKLKVISAPIVVQRIPAKNSDQFRGKRRICDAERTSADETYRGHSAREPVLMPSAHAGEGQLGRYLGSFVRQCWVVSAGVV
ncbi:MAG: hypothetical protein WA418_30120 [Bradyrhizobium sp.]